MSLLHSKSPPAEFGGDLLKWGPGLITESTESSSPKEFHSQALTQPDVNLSIHPAPIVQPFRRE